MLLPLFPHRNVSQDQLQGVHSRAYLQTVTNLEHPLTNFRSSAEYHQQLLCTPGSYLMQASDTSVRECTTSQGLVPFSVFNSTEPRVLAASQSNQDLRPQGFSPSRRFAPRRAFRIYFAPNPLLGFVFRGFHPHSVPFVLSNVAALMTFDVANRSITRLAFKA